MGKIEQDYQLSEGWLLGNLPLICGMYRCPSSTFDIGLGLVLEKK